MYFLCLKCIYAFVFCVIYLINSGDRYTWNKIFFAWFFSSSLSLNIKLNRSTCIKTNDRSLIQQIRIKQMQPNCHTFQGGTYLTLPCRTEWSNSCVFVTQNHFSEGMFQLNNLKPNLISLHVRYPLLTSTILLTLWSPFLLISNTKYLASPLLPWQGHAIAGFILKSSGCY